MIKNMRLNFSTMRYLPYLTMFLMGVNLFKLYIPFVLFCWVVYARRLNVTRSVLFLFILVFFSVFFLFVIGHQRMTLDNTWQVFIAFNITLFTSTIIFNNSKLEKNFAYLKAYILGVGAVTLLSVLYSYWYNDGSYGRGLIYNPITQATTNSPLASNNLSLLTSLCVFFLFKQKMLIRKFLMFSCIGLLAILGAFLGGRTYFIIVGLSLIYMLLIDDSERKLITIAIFIGCLLLAIFLFWEQAVFLQENSMVLLQRFEQGATSGDVRFDLLVDGFWKLLSHPLGGYEVSSSVSSVRWFHNIFIDMGRLAGWIPVILLLLAVFYVIFRVAFNKINRKFIDKPSLLFFILSFLLLQQDIAIEGDYRVLVIMILSGMFVVDKRIYHNTAIK